ncbi:SH3 domain-containing protein [Bacillus sp. JJ783]|uniref:SH3 domain-containing protein n=1 Tax=Bacillus sp. JJ783 TaxID=3122974 RepID=UPI002FFE49EF
MDKLLEWFYKSYIFLLSIPIAAPIRFAIILFLIMFIGKYLIFYLFPYASKKILGLLEWCIKKLVNGITRFISATMRKRRQKGKRVSAVFSIAELLISIIDKGFEYIKMYALKFISFIVRLEYKYKITMRVCIVIIPILIYVFPTNSYTLKVYESENKLIQEHLIPLGFDPQTLSASSEGKTILKVKDEMEGGNVRQEARIDAEVVEAVSPGVELVYLEENVQVQDSDNEQRTWLKVRLPDGNIGWISGAIVEKVQ